jgi:cell division protein FtsI/penicillin-binding protein 2
MEAFRVRLHHLIPSMFQRRLLFLMAAIAGCALLPMLQMGRLTLAKGDELRADAQKRLVNETWTVTSRGKVVDRKGRELAIDRPSLDIAVDYKVITGRWAEEKAIRVARKTKEAAGGNWVTMSQEDREEAIRLAREPFEAHLRAMWTLFAKTAGISEEQLEQRKRDIIEQVQYGAALAMEQKRKRDLQKWEQAGKKGAPPSETVRVVIQEERESHVILRGVPDQIGFAFDRLKDITTDEDDVGVPGGKPLPVMPGLHVVDSARREYPYDVMTVEVDTSVFPPPLRGDVRQIRVPGVAMHLLGRMRTKLYKEDMDRRPRVDPSTGKVDRGHYRPGDNAGQGGVEQAKEDVLRGLRGAKLKHLETGEEEITPREPGRDVTLTIDAALQARIQALFDPSLGLTVVQPWQRAKKPDEEPKPNAPKDLPLGTPLNGAVVVIDVPSGDVLAMVSMPSYTHEQIATMPDTIANDPFNQAFLNRAIAKVYPPGSIVKPLVLCEAIKNGRYSPDERIECTGHFFADKPLLYRCWIYKQFHTTHTARLGHNLDGADGIKCSCNIFFFEMGKRLGPVGMHNLYTTYGVGRDAEPFNIFGLPELPTDQDAKQQEQQRRGLLYEAMGDVKGPEKCSSQEAILMGIGQGPVDWTPLHAANGYAALARHGVLLTPRIYADAQQQRKDLGIPARAIAQALKGLHGSANEENGTTHVITYPMPDGSKKSESVFSAPGISIWAKSGTADTNPFQADLGQQDGRDELYDSDHAWCVCLAGVGDEPRYAVACVIDYGGSGGKVAGPVANQVIHALVAEGYLPNLRGSTPAKRKGESN